jgi:hypothetical protein
LSAADQNRDLVWDLMNFKRRQLAAHFIKRFENKLCIFSGSVEQLYTNYSIYFPEEENRKMVILPNPYAYHDTFQGIPEQAVTKTGMNIIPGEVIGKAGLYLTVPVQNGSGGQAKVIALQSALKAINARRPPHDPFLPVLIKGDLREFRQQAPMLHLHCIRLHLLGERSELERNSLRGVIERKLPQIA